MPNSEAKRNYNKIYNATVYECPCGSTTILGNKAEHNRSKKHIEYTI